MFTALWMTTTRFGRREPVLHKFYLVRSRSASVTERTMYRITDECIACAACADECPEEAISESEDGEMYVINQDMCTDCGTCFDTCPVEAIIKE